MKKNIFYSKDQGLLSIQEAISFGFDVKVTSPSMVLSTFGLERLVQTIPPETDEFHYLEETNPIRGADGLLYRAYISVGYFDHLEEAEYILQQNQLRYHLDQDRCERERNEANQEFNDEIELGFFDEATGEIFGFSSEDLFSRMKAKEDPEEILYNKDKIAVKLPHKEAKELVTRCDAYHKKLTEKRSDKLILIRDSQMKPPVNPAVIEPAPEPAE